MPGSGKRVEALPAPPGGARRRCVPYWKRATLRLSICARRSRTPETSATRRSRSRGSSGLRFGQRDAHRVDLLAVDLHLVVQVGPGGPAGHAHGADASGPAPPCRRLRAPAANPCRCAYSGGVLVAVLEDDHVAVAALLPGELDRAVGGGAHARADRRAEVDPLVRAPVAQDGVHPRSGEPGGDPAELERVAQEASSGGCGRRR